MENDGFFNFFNNIIDADLQTNKNIINEKNNINTDKIKHSKLYKRKTIMSNNDFFTGFNMSKEFYTTHDSSKEEEYYSKNAGDTKVIKILALVAVVLFSTMLFIPKNHQVKNLTQKANSSLNINKNLQSKYSVI
jgi:hypothetical protein